jgi:polar amino acid transport system permease protein
MRTFGPTEFLFLVKALRWTVALFVIAFVTGSVGGLVIAILRISPYRILRVAAGGFIELFQGTPMLLQLFVAYYGLGLVGLQLDAWTASAIALGLHSAAYLGEIWRGSIQAIPVPQWEGARALSFSYLQMLRLIILPQAVRSAIAPSVGFLVSLIKGTSVTALIGFVEVTRAGVLVANVTLEPFRVFTVVSVLYLCLCWPLSMACRRLERRFST